MIGLDLLGLAKHDLKNIIPYLQPGTAIGALMGTFGGPLPKLEVLIKTGKIAAVRVHLTNGCGYRNGNAEPAFDPKATDYVALAKRAKAVEALAKKYPATKFYVSPRLEHDEKDPKVVNQWIKILKESAPSCTIVISAFTGYVPKGFLVEKHGNGAKADIISNDGESLTDADAAYLKNGKLITFAWIHTMNGRGPGDKAFLVPSKRKPDSFSTAKDIDYCMRWLQGKEAQPAGNLPKVPEILKPYAEYYSTAEDIREKKPVLIVKPAVGVLDITDLKGKKIGVARAYPGLLNGMTRYYSDLLSVDLMDKAKSQWTYWTKGKVKYLVNVLFRSGKMR